VADTPNPTKVFFSGDKRPREGVARQYKAIEQRCTVSDRLFTASVLGGFVLASAARAGQSAGSSSTRARPRADSLATLSLSWQRARPCLRRCSTWLSLLGMSAHKPGLHAAPPLWTSWNNTPWLLQRSTCLSTTCASTITRLALARSCRAGGRTACLHYSTDVNPVLESERSSAGWDHRPRVLQPTSCRRVTALRPAEALG